MPEMVTPVATEKDDDPSALTTQMALREDMHLRDLMNAKLARNFDVLNSRFDAMDKAITLLQAYPTEVDRAFSRLKELHEEKFQSVERQFKDKETAVNAAFQAEKEAGIKSDNGFTKQIDQLTSLIHANAKNIDDKISDMKDRLNRDEGRKAGLGQSWGVIVSAVAVASALTGTVIVLLGNS